MPKAICKRTKQPGRVHAHSDNIWEVEAGGSEVQASPAVDAETEGMLAFGVWECEPHSHNERMEFPQKVKNYSHQGAQQFLYRIERK